MAGGDFWSALLAQRQAHWDALRDAGPVVERDGVYHLTRRAEVVAALRDPDVFSAAIRAGVGGFEVVSLPLVQAMDSPEHDRYREALRPMFGPQVVGAHLPDATRQAGALVDRVVGDGTCDVMRLVRQYGVEVMQSFLGLPPQEGAEVFTCKHAAMFGARGTPEHLAAVFRLFGYVSAAVDERRRNPLPGLLSQLQGALGDTDAISIGYSLLGGAGNNENIVLGSAFLALACNPPLRRLLCADPGQTKVLVDEVLRLDAPSPWLPRVTTCEVTVGGVRIPAGSEVRVHLGAINRDDGDDGITVTDGRIVRHRNWAFGAGPHRCPGANLARAVMTTLINEWLRRIPDFEVAESPSLPEQAVELPSLRLRWDEADTDMFSMAHRAFTRAALCRTGSMPSGG